MKINGIERIDMLTEDNNKQLLFWINLYNPEIKIEEIAKEIEQDHNDEYDEKSFYIGLNYDLNTSEFNITIPLYYMDSDGNPNYIDYNVSEELLNNMIDMCINELKLKDK